MTTPEDPIVVPGDVCRLCGTVVGWKCCCGETRTTLPVEVVITLDPQVIEARGRAQQEELYASGWTVPGAQEAS